MIKLDNKILLLDFIDEKDYKELFNKVRELGYTIPGLTHEAVRLSQYNCIKFDDDNKIAFFSEHTVGTSNNEILNNYLFQKKSKNNIIDLI